MTVSFQTPHEAQLRVLSEAKRFNVLSNGRRWGKTVLSIRLLKEAITKSYKIGYWTPTYKDLSEVWNDVKYRFHDVIESKNEQLKELRLKTGGRIDFWSMDEPDSGRGRGYHRAIIDEFAKAGKGEEAWKQTISPTLSDYLGDAWFLSTPKGTNGYFYELFNNRDKFDNWASWQLPTWTNPHIPTEAIEEARNQLDPVTFRQEYGAEFTNILNKPFIYSFEPERHIDDSIEFNPNETVYFSFDFNIDPMTCVIAQHGHDWIHVLDEIRLNNSNTHEACEHIMTSKYMDSFKMVTGDASGMSRNTQTKGNVNNYTIIVNSLHINPNSQLIVPSHNPPISESRTLTNSLFANHKRIKIHSRCKYLIEDIMFVQVNDKGEIDKTKDKHKAHLIDGLRYYFNTWHGDFITSKKY